MAIGKSSKKSRYEKEWQIKFSALDTNIIEDNKNDPIVVLAIISITW